MNLILLSILTLVGIAGLSAIILHWASKKFYVEEDQQIVLVEKALPNVNCGGCGYKGCKSFAEACVTVDSLANLYCPVGGKEVMQEISDILGKSATEKPLNIAVVRCNGSCEKRGKINIYDGAKNCTVASAAYGSETGCSYGCLGWGDCVKACKFGAIAINQTTGLPEVNKDKCTACGACAKVCPKAIIELRLKKPQGNIYVGCVNKDKGGIARKACEVACIACGKCEKVCQSEAININNNLAYINDQKCTLCGECVSICPTKAIING